MEGVLDEVIIDFPFSWDDSRQVVRFEGQSDEASVPDVVVVCRECPAKCIVVKVEMPKCNKLLSEVFRKCSCQQVPTNVKMDALAPSQIGRKWSGELVRVHIEIFCVGGITSNGWYGMFKRKRFVYTG